MCVVLVFGGSPKPSGFWVFSLDVCLKCRPFWVLFPEPNSMEPVLRPRFVRDNLPLPLMRSSASFVVLSNYSTQRILLKRSLAVLTH